MTISNFTQAVNAYQNAAKAAESIGKNIEQAGVLDQTPEAYSQGASFADLVGGALKNSRDATYKAEAISTQGLLGQADLTDVITAVAGAEMALNTVISVRDRVINAYQEIIKMPI
jgi:flagellar hook-basal body complex protein FliE